MKKVIPKNDLEMLYDILKKNISAYKLDLLTNNLLTLNFIKRLYSDGIIKNDDVFFWSCLSDDKTITFKFISENLKIKWNWDKVSWNPNITYKHAIIERPDLPWNWDILCYHIYIPKNILKEYSYIPWNWNSLSINPHITFDYVLENIHEDWDWNALTQHHSISWDQVVNNITLPWDWDNILLNPNFSDNILSIPNYKYDLYDYYHRYCFCRVIPIEYVLSNIELPWNWGALSYNKFLTIEHILSNTDKAWDWDGLSSNNNNITIDDVIKNNHLPWSWEYITYKKNLTIDHVLKHELQDKLYNWNWYHISTFIVTWDDVLKYPHLPYDWSALSINENITWDHILTNMDKDWDWNYISIHRENICEMTQKHPKLPWVWENISLNKHITWEFVIHNSDKQWDISNLILNEFNYDNRLKKYIDWKCRDVAARIIQRACDNWIDKPICNDGTLGISLRLGLKYINENRSK